MITVLSPAKSLDFCEQSLTKTATVPDFLDDSQALIDRMRKFTKPKVAELMGISDKLADLNVQRYKDFSTPFTPDNSKQSLLAFTGDVYQGFDLESWKTGDFNFAQKHLRILSGLYGLLRPLDLIQPYRLEMGTKLKTERGKDLYAFWGDTITDAVNGALKDSKSKVLVNLASNEYYSSVRPANLDAEVVTPVFKDEKNGKFKIISFFAKRARGMMANFIIQNRIKKPADLKAFDEAGYYFDEDSSDGNQVVFLRAEQAK